MQWLLLIVCLLATSCGHAKADPFVTASEMQRYVEAKSQETFMEGILYDRLHPALSPHGIAIHSLDLTDSITCGIPQCYEGTMRLSKGSQDGTFGVRIYLMRDQWVVDSEALPANWLQ